MRKLFFTLALILTSMVASAQFYVGGSLGLSSANGGNAGKSTTFSIMPEVGYSFDNRWSLGGTLGFEWKKGEKSTFKVAPYARYAFIIIGKFAFYADGIIQLGVIDTKSNNAEFCWGAGISPGFDFYMTDNITLSTRLGWIGHRDDGNEGEETAVIINGNELTFGISYSF